jgi:DNA-binding HxlR family transcriptional regulator
MFVGAFWVYPTVDVLVYDLTDWGRKIGAAVYALEHWAAEVPPAVSVPPSRWDRSKPNL